MSQKNQRTRDFYRCWNGNYTSPSNSKYMCTMCPNPGYFIPVSSTPRKDFSIEAILSKNNCNEYRSGDKIERNRMGGETSSSTSPSMSQRGKHFFSRHSSYSTVYCKVNDNTNEELYEDPRNNKRMRTIFTPDQLERLEQEFTYQQYMVGGERIYLAQELGLSEQQVKVWFQNRRIKWRKHNLEKLRNKK